MAYNGYFSLTNSVGGCCGYRVFHIKQKQNELPIVDLRNQEMRISFCKKVEMELTFNPHAVVGKPKIGAQFWGQIQILTSSCVRKSKQTSTIFRIHEP